MTEDAAEGNEGHRKYFPILKAKRGELRALGNFPPERCHRVTPLLEVQPPGLVLEEHVGPDGKKYTDDRLETVDEVIAKLPALLAKHCAMRFLYLDAPNFEPGARTAAGQHPFEWLLDEVRKADVAAIPVTDLERDAEQVGITAAAARRDRRGAAIRLRRDDLRGPALSHLATRLEELRAGLALPREEIDLFLDFGRVGQLSLPTFATEARDAIKAVPEVDRWRTLILCSGAFPPASAVKSREQKRVERYDWSLWIVVVADKDLPRLPAFGDYGVTEPEFKLFDPRKASTSAKLRFTDKTEWLILKGQSLRDHGYEQYQGLAASLRSLKGFSQAHCVGDQTVAAVASGKAAGNGNPETWIVASTTHHLHTVDEQIASLV